MTVGIDEQKTAPLVMSCENTIVVPAVIVWGDQPSCASLASTTKRT